MSQAAGRATRSRCQPANRRPGSVRRGAYMKRDGFRVHFGGGEWNERRWAMQQTRWIASAVTGCGLALAMSVLGGVSVARGAQPVLPASDKPAAILVWPKIVVDTSDALSSSTGSTDTLIQLSS